MSASYSHATIVGNLTRDPELKATSGGTQLCELSVAVNRTSGSGATKREHTSFFDVKLWGKTAEVAAQYLAKGRCVLISGRLEQESWEDKTTGQKRSKVVIVGETMQMIGGDRGESRGADRPAAPTKRERSPADSFYDMPSTSGVDKDDEDVPF